jgi:DNA-binding CsgD family transcriptional regulator
MNEIEKKHYLAELIQHYNIALDDELLLSILNPEFKLLYCTRAFCNLLGLQEKKDYLGKRMEELNPRIQQIIVSFYKIFSYLIKLQTSIDYLILFDFIESHWEIFRAHSKAMYYPDNTLLGIKTMINKHDIFGYHKLINAFLVEKKYTITSLNTPLPDNLTEKEKTILFLLVANFNQYEIAEILAIPRTTITRIINHSLLDKMKVVSTKCLIEKAIQLGIGNDMPKALFQPKVIILEQDLAF